MLEPRHILRLKLDKWRLNSHMVMPPPPHATKRLTGQFSAISGTVLTTLFKVDPDVFAANLSSARKLGAEYVCNYKDGRIVGVSVATSLVRRGDIMCKNLIVPKNLTEKHPRLDERVVISAFVHGDVEDDSLDFDGNVEIVGWATVNDIKTSPTQGAPTTFITKMRHILAIPCSELRPISELLELVNTSTVVRGTNNNKQNKEEKE